MKPRDIFQLFVGSGMSGDFFPKCLLVEAMYFERFKDCDVFLNWQFYQSDLMKKSSAELHKMHRGMSTWNMKQAMLSISKYTLNFCLAFCSVDSCTGYDQDIKPIN